MSEPKDPGFGKPTELDPLHPTGRCTCGGEGRCAWCAEICQTCGGTAVADEPWHVCDACKGTGYADGLELTAGERAAKVEAIRANECDYAALGYPETELWSGDALAFHSLAVGARSSWTLLFDLGVIQKRYPFPIG